MKKDKFDQLVTKKEFSSSIKGLNKRMDRIDKRLDGVDKRLDRVDKRLDRVDKRFDGVDERFDGVDKRLISLKEYIDYRFSEFEKIVYTKADHEVFMIWMDEAMKELRDTREGRVLTEKQVLCLDDKVADHENRICALEKK